MPASGRHSHKGHGKKRKICRSIPASSFLPVFALSVVGNLYEFDKIKWSQSVAWLDFGMFFPTPFPIQPIQSTTPNSHQRCGQLNDDL